MLLMPFLFVAGGLLLLLLGGEVLLRGAVSLASGLGLSPLLIGMTVVAAATSMPELVVSVAAGLEDAPDLGVGNVVGSNIANVLLILGVATLIHPVIPQPRQVMRDGLATLIGTLVFIGLALAGTIGRLEGVAMVALLTLYIAYSYQQDRKRRNGLDAAAATQPVAETRSIQVSFLLVAGGVGLMVAGSKLLIDGAVDVARAAGVTESVIGLTLVAVGTSLPELATAFVASFRRHPEVALGNVLGSNLFNLLAIIPALAITTPVMVAPEILTVDMWVMAGVTVACLAFLLSGWRMGRVEGSVFLIAYAAYIAMLFNRGQGVL